MKTVTVKEIADTVAIPNDRQYPVGKAQAIVLNKLGLTATGFAHAEAIFKALGIVVTPVRKADPTVTILPREAGGMNQHGEGEVWQQYPDVVGLSALA